MSASGVVVYLGPSMPRRDAEGILDAEYRPPARRGDLAGAAPGTVVAIIDGVFDQTLSVSPGEVREAVTRGVVVFGGSSMGALRAAEVPGMIGLGLVYEWYRDGIIRRDDEVALLFDPLSGRPLTVPAVSVRFAAERLCSLGTIGPELASALVSAALQIPYKERTYPRIIEAAGVAGREDAADLLAMMQAHDIKYRDAQTVLEAVDRYVEGRSDVRGAEGAGKPPPPADPASDDHPLGSGILVWESGDRATVNELLDFLGFTGKLEWHARAVLARSALDPGPTVADGRKATSVGAQVVFNSAASRWGWASSEEAGVTLADLGLGASGVGEQCAKEALASELAADLARDRSSEFREAMKAELFMDDMALKRETMRLASLRFFAGRAEGPATQGELDEARAVLCKVNRQYRYATLCQRWARLGLSDGAVQGAVVEQLALARRAGRRLARAMAGRPPAAEATSIRAGLAGFGLGPRPKPKGEPRFCLKVASAREHARRIGEHIGVTRVGMIGELADLGGVQIAQAARPGNAWSSSYGSGKSRTEDGAVVGSIMEEAEKWAQEQFRPGDTMPVGSFRDLRTRDRFIDPATLDLPYDSSYREEMSLHWYPCFDLLEGREVHVPVDFLQLGTQKHDICFTRRGARKHLATNGLGSGFAPEEAVLHGLCEYVERHAQRLAELLLVNPGGIGSVPFRFVDLETCSAGVRDLADRLGRRADIVRVLEITSEIRIPTFVATVTRDLQRADGYGTHPDPNTAIEMALLEAAQTIASATAGGREDLSIRARSLGRHERPRPICPRDAWFWLDPDADFVPLDHVDGLSSADVFEDLIWCLGRVRAAGVDHVLAVDLTPPGIEPARVVRVIVPGLETNNPFFTGPRARLVLLRDLLPR